MKIKVEETVLKDNSRGVTWKSEDHISVNNRFSMLSETNAEATFGVPTFRLLEGPHSIK